MKIRKAKLGIQALAPNGRALEWTMRYRPRGLKLVIVSPGDFVGWMHQIPEETFVIGRYFGDGNIDYLPWTPENGAMLADRIKIVHDMNLGRINAWECVNEPIAHTVDAMQRLATFQRVWADNMRDKGLVPIVGNFSVGNPKVLSADGINLMQHFRPAMEAGDYFAMHGYGCPEAMSHSRWQALRYKELFVDAGMTMPVILTECGRDCGSTGHGYKEDYSDEEYIPQLIQLDQALQADKLVKLATVFCLGTYGSWKTFDLTDNAGRMLGEYIVEQGDIEEGTMNSVKIWRRDLAGGPVQTMGVEDYLGGVVCSEMYCSWPLEALKVQAVAARAYVIYHQEHGGKHPAQGADLCTEACCQVYRASNITDKSIRTVTETKGIRLLDTNNKAIQSEYISICGMPACPHCEGRPGYNGKQWPGRMCQWGAKVSAEQGKSWREILKFYYPHAHLSDEQAPSPPPPPEEDIAEQLLEDLDHYLPPWNDRQSVGYNPHIGLAKAARLAQPPLGLPISSELRGQFGSKLIVYQFFWRGLAWCPEKEYNNIHIARY